MLKLEIKNQRIIPVRQIPFVTGWKFSPDEVVRILSRNDKWHRVFIPSFHYQKDNTYGAMLPKEWDVITADLDILSNKLKAEESVEDENYPKWREESVKQLPAATFVWLADLETAWNTAYSKDRITLLDERPGDRDLNLNPRLPKELLKIIFEGFETLTLVPDINKSSNENLPVTFNELQHYLITDPFYGFDSAATESIVNSIYRENSENAFFQEFHRRYSLLPCKTDKQRELIYLWCGLMDLPTLNNGQPSNWAKEYFLENWRANFQIRLADLKEFLRKNSWPLPAKLFPNEVDNSERKILIEEDEFERAFHDFTVILPQLKKELTELQNIQPESMEARNQKKSEVGLIEKQINNIISENNDTSDTKTNSTESADYENKLNIGSPEWRSKNARNAANIKHDQPGGSRDKKQQIRDIWATGKFSSRDICAEEECAALGMPYSTARKALRNTPDPETT